MTNEHDTRTRIVLSWLREDAHENAERVLLAALNDVDHTQQRRAWWPAWRFADMNNFAKVLVATATVVAVAVVAINLSPGGRSGTGAVPPSPSTSPTARPSPSMNPTQKPSVSPETHVLMPSGPDGITFTLNAPPSWERFGELGVWPRSVGNDLPDGAFVASYLGDRGLFRDPCRPEIIAEDPDIAVGPTVDDLVAALVDHPSLDVTSPVDVTLAGYSGRYLDLEIPDDISACAAYRPMDIGHHYAQGPGQRWHMWVLDVDRVRVLVETNDYPGTAPERLGEVKAIVDSLQINP